MEIHKILYLKEDETPKWLKEMDFKVTKSQAETIYCWQELLFNKIFEIEGCSEKEALRRLWTFNAGVTDYFLTKFAEKRNYSNLVKVYERTKTVKVCDVHEGDALCERKKREREWKRIMEEISASPID